MEPNFTALKYNCRLFDKGPGISLKLRQRSELIFLKTLEPIFNMFFLGAGLEVGVAVVLVDSVEGVVDPEVDEEAEPDGPVEVAEAVQADTEKFRNISQFLQTK